MISVVIPTLQKDINVLKNLLDSLNRDEKVGEIILIDNSLKGIDYKNEKLRVITPEENLFVNPSWNLGVKEAKFDLVALLNDDLALPENFCSSVVEKMSPEMGIVGFHSNGFVETRENITSNPEKTELYLEKAPYMDQYWGITLFFYKEAYTPTPEGMKINYGDIWIMYCAKKQGRKNYRISGQILYHIGSLSTKSINLSPIQKQDCKIFKRLTVKWYHRIFSFEEVQDFFKIRLLGITLKIPKIKF